MRRSQQRNRFISSAMSSEPDYSHLEAQYFTPEYASPLDTLVILDGAPVVGPDRASKLVGAIRKAAQKEGGLVLDDSAFEMPLADDGLKSKGFLFVTLPNEAHGGVDAVMHPCEIYWLQLRFPVAGLALPGPSAFRSTGKQGRHSEHRGFLLAEMQHLQRTYPGGVW